MGTTPTSVVESGAAQGSLATWLDETRGWTEEHLANALANTAAPSRHASALEYALLGGGKRLRPALVRLVCRALGGIDADAAAPAVAIEMLHTYSLVHDDLPCMDDDELRRGRPTCHVVYGEAQAVLVGDGLQALAFEVLAAARHARVAEMVRVLAREAGPAGMVGGQALDLEAESGLAIESVREIHRRKTAALVSAAAELGALAADADPERCTHLRTFGFALGLCFQAVDDVLDVTGDAHSLGKTPGKDAAAEKATLVAALGLEGARAEARERAQEAHACLARARLEADGERLLGQLVDHFLDRSA